MLRLFDERHVTGLFEYLPTNIWDVVKERLHGRRRRLVEAARVLRPGGVFAGTDSQPGWRFRLIHLADTCNPVDPGTLAARLAAAGFGQIQIDTSHHAVSFAARAPAAAR